MNVCVFYIYKYKIWDDLEKKNRKVKEEDYDIFYTSIYTSSIKDVSIIRVKRVEREISSRREKKNHESWKKFATARAIKFRKVCLKRG